MNRAVMVCDEVRVILHQRTGSIYIHIVPTGNLSIAKRHILCRNSHIVIGSNDTPGTGEIFCCLDMNILSFEGR